VRVRGQASVCLLAVAAVAVAANARAATFKAVAHPWQVGISATSVSTVASGKTLTECASKTFSAVTPSLAYSGAPVGETYSEKVVGPAAAGTITILGLVNVDGDHKPLKFTSATGVWDNTYAIMSFPHTAGHPTLPTGKYTFEVLLGGKVLASTSISLGSKAGC
jgi:hypothetical protein